MDDAAFRVVSDALGVTVSSEQPKRKNPSAVKLGRLGGKKGGKARAAKLSAEERVEIARKAARTRWSERPPRG